MAYEIKFRDGREDEGSNRSWFQVLQVFHNGELISEYDENMCPEDTCFSRDLKWIAPALLKAYELGWQDKHIALFNQLC